MNDNYHSLGEQESHEYFMLHQSTSSPISTSSSSSPMTNIIQNSSIGSNWQSTAFPFDPVVSQYDNEHSHLQQRQFPWALTHPQQHQEIIFQQHNRQYQLQLQQQLQYQQQHEIWRSHLDMQNSAIYQNNQPQTRLFQFPTLPTEDVHYFPHQQPNIPHIPIDTRNIPIDNPSIPNMPTTFSPLQKTFIIDTANNKKKRPQTLESTSPNVTPLPSPVLPSSSKRKRVTRNMLLEKDDVDERGEKRKKNEEEGVRVEFKGNLKAVDQLERELEFLGDECATILIMLDSLRNAFLADIPTSSLQQKPAPMLPSISTFDSRKENHIPYTTNITNHVPPVVDTRRPSKIIAQNPEMEREMRTAYDDLWLQTRQLEKKVEVLEVKSKTASITEDTVVKKKKKNLVVDDDEEDVCSQSSEVLSSVLSEEEIDQDDDYLLESRSKKKSL